MKESGPGDHRGVVRGQACRGGEYLDPSTGESFPHGGRERGVACDSTAEHDPLSPVLPQGARRLFDERIDERVLKRAGNLRAMRIDVLARRLHGVEHGRLESAERDIEVIRVTRFLVAAEHGARETIGTAVALLREAFDVRAPRIWQTEQLGNFIEGFAGGVVSRPTEHAIAAPRLHVE